MRSLGEAGTAADARKTTRVAAGAAGSADVACPAVDAAVGRTGTSAWAGAVANPVADITAAALMALVRVVAERENVTPMIPPRLLLVIQMLQM